MHHTVREAMQPVVENLDIMREVADASNNTIRAEALREAISAVRSGISEYERRFVENIKDTIAGAYRDAYSSWLLVDEIKEMIQEKVDEAKSDAIDSVKYELETNHEWSETDCENYEDLMDEVVAELIREDCLDEGFDV